MGALLLQQLYYEQLEDIRDWVHRNTARYEAGSELTPFPVPRQYSARELQGRLFVGTSLSTINRLLKDLESRRLVTFLPGSTKQIRRISLSAEVGQTVNMEIERRYQASQAPRAKA